MPHKTNLLRFLLKTAGICLLIVCIAWLARYLYMKPQYAGGEKAPPITSQLMDGSDFNLAQLNGKYILLDFWGSWCSPCRAESPQLVKFYEQYHEASFADADGFEIVSIGIETKVSRWLRAIQKDGLLWPYHIMDKATSLRFFDSPIAADYGIREVPTKYLLNPRGEIIGVNLSFDEMRKHLEKHLTN